MTGSTRKRFELLFKELFKPLCGFAIKYVGNLDDSKNIVHEVFMAVWEKFDSLPEDTNFKSYLYTATRNRCLNLIRDRKNLVPLENISTRHVAMEEKVMETKELEREIELAINLLPEKCRMVFEMSRVEELKYAEIAEKMNISQKTVEAHMAKALQILRRELAQYLSLILFIFGG